MQSAMMSFHVKQIGDKSVDLVKDLYCTVTIGEKVLTLAKRCSSKVLGYGTYFDGGSICHRIFVVVLSSKIEASILLPDDVISIST